MGIRSIRGMNDVLPDESIKWKRVRQVMDKVLGSYGFREILIPVLEETRLFQRGIGETTDIVEKEMYTFEDRSGQSLTLRPEATASIVRAFIQHHLFKTGKVEKYYFWGPMFRYERPQKGRYRQFFQIDVEAFGSDDPTLDTDIIASLYDFLAALQVPGVTIELNSLGCPVCRPAYHQALTAYFADKQSELCPDCRSRLVRNPLRILDCKKETCHALVLDAPSIHAFLCETCRDHFHRVQAYLKDLVAEVYRHPFVHVITEATITDVSGYIGNFVTTVDSKGWVRKIEHGAAILAIGADEYKPTEYLYGQDDRVVTYLELEEKIAGQDEGLKEVENVVMIQCVGCRNEDRNYCSRVCCGQAVKNALKLKELNPKADVYILYRDMRTYGFREDAYRMASENRHYRTSQEGCSLLPGENN